MKGWDLKNGKPIWPWILGWYLALRYADRIVPIPESWLPAMVAVMIILPVAGLLFLAWREYRSLSR
jgi:hypothetical protein